VVLPNQCAPLTFPHAAADLVVRTRLVAPRLRSHIVARPRLDALLARALEHPLTIVRAEAGYGKTTAVASYLSRIDVPHLWFHVGDTDVEPRQFLLHLIHAFASLHPTVGNNALERLSRGERSPRAMAEAVDILSNDLLDSIRTNTILVLDDYDRVNTVAVNAITERLVETMPPQLHVVITTRTMPGLRSRARLRASGELLEVSRADLAFTSDEVGMLFGRGNTTISAAEARLVTAETEGWPIALQMLSDSIAGERGAALENLLQRIPGSADLLFDYLAEEVFLRQPADVRTFLGESASLRWLDPELCDYALGVSDSATLLRFLEQRSLFLTAEGGIRYHNLFNDFLLRRSGTTPERRAHIHRRAAEFFAASGRGNDAVHHLLAAGEYHDAAAILVGSARSMLEDGQHHSLSQWLDRLPESVIDSCAELVLARAETYRLASRFADALPMYERARRAFRDASDSDGELRAIRSHALVYLDSVQPARAEPLLRDAFRRSRGDRAWRAASYALLAENRLNLGDTRTARRMFTATRRFASGTSAPLTQPRVLVREGRLAEAREMLDDSRRAEPDATVRPRPPRSHREVSAILAWIEALMGDAESARLHAAESLEVGRALGSPVVECISQTRLGFAWLAGQDFDSTRAHVHFADALRSAERLGVPRFRAEPLLGQLIVHGLERKPDDALSAGREAQRIVTEAGDGYLSAVISVALGAALSLGGRGSAEEWLLEGIRNARLGGDAFTETLATLWLAIHLSKRGEPTRARTTFVSALHAIRENKFEFLFSGRSLLAPRDASLWSSLLRRSQEDASIGEYARMLADAGPGASDYQRLTLGTNDIATATLYVQTLGPFRLWMHGKEVARSAWAREKALHLFQLLLTNRGKPVHRDQVLESLWPESPVPTAATGLRVALSALRNALEPDRESGADSRFVRRDGENIRLAMEVGVRIDADEFGEVLQAARVADATDVELAITLYERALALYRGEYLAEVPYANWADTERQQRRRELLTNGERLSRLLLNVGEPERAARWAELLLQHDPLWEGAYVILMESYWRQGNRALAVRTYDRCRKRLKEALGVAPSPATVALMEQISG
jgi:LuxR family transcriptional regulator, maltose regulon positive regulatory protein